jgi:hypothetical protein
MSITTAIVMEVQCQHYLPDRQKKGLLFVYQLRLHCFPTSWLPSIFLQRSYF